jgi:hypothetical protein
VSSYQNKQEKEKGRGTEEKGKRGVHTRRKRMVQGLLGLGGTRIGEMKEDKEEKMEDER